MAKSANLDVGFLEIGHFAAKKYKVIFVNN